MFYYNELDKMVFYDLYQYMNNSTSAIISINIETALMSRPL